MYTTNQVRYALKTYLATASLKPFQMRPQKNENYFILIYFVNDFRGDIFYTYSRHIQGKWKNEKITYIFLYIY